MHVINFYWKSLGLLTCKDAVILLRICEILGRGDLMWKRNKEAPPGARNVACVAPPPASTTPPRWNEQFCILFVAFIIAKSPLQFCLLERKPWKVELVVFSSMGGKRDTCYISFVPTKLPSKLHVVTRSVLCLFNFTRRMFLPLYEFPFAYYSEARKLFVNKPNIWFFSNFCSFRG